MKIIHIALVCLILPVRTTTTGNVWTKTWVTVMLVTSLCWWLYDGDRFEMLVAESSYWQLFSLRSLCFQCIKSVTNILNRSPTSQNCHQHIWSPTSVTNIDVTDFNNHCFATCIVCRMPNWDFDLLGITQWRFKRRIFGWTSCKRYSDGRWYSACPKLGTELFTRGRKSRVSWSQTSFDLSINC